MSDESTPPLHGIRVLDLTDEFGGYAGRLLAGLGAEVIKVEDQGAIRPLQPPVVTAGSEPISLFDEYVNAGKKSVVIPLGTEEGTELLHRLVASSDVVLGAIGGAAPGSLLSVNPDLVHVVITPFGWEESPPWAPIDDLIVLGAGGLLHLGGYSDIGPVGPFGGQSQIASGIFGAVAVIVGLIDRDKTGKGNWADVSAQEAVAQALEDSLPAFVLTGQIREAQGEFPREAGSGLYACSDGYVSMVAGRLGTARAWKALVEWLARSEPEAAELRESHWDDFAVRQSAEATERFRYLFETFASTKSKQELYLEAQSRGIALSPVNDVDDLLENEQLAARSFFVTFKSPRLGVDVVGPGSPFRLSDSPLVSLGAAPFPGGDTEEILASLGRSRDDAETRAKGESV